jgi:glycosyltransferase involved in cell wall biosynthesis
VRYPDDHRQERLSAVHDCAAVIGPASSGGPELRGAASALTRTSHLAALPFPTRQGTQAAIASMLRALREADREAQLLCYAHGLSEPEPPFTVHRGSGWSRDRSLRSGPSARKLIADVELAALLDRTRRARAGDLVIAHHVEAALLARRVQHVFFAHTDLGEELPSYAPRALDRALRRAGSALDRWLIQRAGAVAAISPLLADRLAAVAGDRAERIAYVPVPWSSPPPITRDERARVRAQLAVPAGTHVVAYVGNLDAYQGAGALVAALPQLNARSCRVLLLIATASDPRPLLAAAQQAGVAVQLRVASLADEPARREVHAAADVIAVPRRTAGGLPIKLLDALARGVPCAITKTAEAGLNLEGIAEVAKADDGAALAAVIESVLRSEVKARALADAGRSFIAREHSAAAFLSAFDRVCERAQR